MRSKSRPKVADIWTSCPQSSGTQHLPSVFEPIAENPVRPSKPLLDEHEGLRSDRRGDYRSYQIVEEEKGQNRLAVRTYAAESVRLLTSG